VCRRSLSSLVSLCLISYLRLADTRTRRDRRRVDVEYTSSRTAISYVSRDEELEETQGVNRGTENFNVAEGNLLRDIQDAEKRDITVTSVTTIGLISGLQYTEKPDITTISVTPEASLYLEFDDDTRCRVFGGI
jgi:hypothetical protein